MSFRDVYVLKASSISCTLVSEENRNRCINSRVNNNVKL